MKRAFLFVLAVLPLAAAAQPAPKPPLTDQQVAEIIIQEARNGSRRGVRSAYSRPGGSEPYCYVKDVPAAEIARYRASH